MKGKVYCISNGEIIKMKKTENQLYRLSEDELCKLQAIEIEIIEEVKRICDKCDIKFNMVGGTMLGAIRHGGHIPWDDDADIGFLRAEYEKFREACKTELDQERFYMQDIRDTTGYRWGYGKLRRKGTEFLRLNQEFMPYEQGVFIDLMPFDNVPDNWIMKRIHFLKCFMIRKMLWSEVGAQTEKNRYKRMAYKVLRKIPIENVIRKYQKLVDKCEKRETKQVRILTFPTPKKVYGYDREWYTDLDEYAFNRLKLPGARDYDGYLKVKYGDYMKLPPKDKQIVHPVSRVKLL